MVGIKNNRRTKYTQEVIKSSFLALLEHKKMPQITVTQICAQADLNRGTFYLHYQDPYHLLQRLQQDFNEEIRAVLHAGGHPCQSEDSLVNMLSVIREKRTLYRMLISDTGKENFLSPLLQEAYQNYWVNGQEPESQPDYGFTYRVQGSLGVINQWLENGAAEEPQTISALISSLGYR